jgi:hypothetical protein
MITLNIDSAFIQVKSDDLIAFTWRNSTVAEVIEMTTQRTMEKSAVSVSTKREGTVSERTGRLDDLLLNAVDETLKHVFRRAGVKVIYGFIENMCHLKREEIAEKPEGFSAGLERLLGSAAPAIEKLILENLYSKLGLRFEEKKGYKLSDYIRELKGKERLINE